ncbi:MAG: 2-hydroxyacid dehydrogenase [Planctomycetia bacterium]|nr:2-hydroxyacid dehydrogenase [Planctomycetia bacterium]
MLVAVFSTQPYDREHLERAAAGTGIAWRWFDSRLDADTVALAADATAVNCFVNDDLNAAVLERLRDFGVRLVTLRCAGFNQVDVPAAARLGLPVVRVPEYSPHAVAEHAVGLVLMLDRRLHKAYNRVREGNFSLDGLLGFDLHGRTVGVVGTGRIGGRFAEIMLGFGCRVLAHDPRENAVLASRGVRFVTLAELLAESDIVSLHCPLTPATHHLIDADRIALMKPGAMLVNTSRGGLVDTRAVIAGLKTGHLGHLGLDVYEEEAGLFFDDKSDAIIRDDVFARLLTFPNVVVTAHQAFFTRNALEAIAAQTVRNLVHFERGEPLEAVVTA